MRTRILQPIALERTLLPGDEVTLPEPHVHSYLSVDGELVDLAQLNPSTAWAAGELVSTAADLNRFYAALLSGELLGEPELADRAATGRPFRMIAIPETFTRTTLEREGDAGTPFGALEIVRRSQFHAVQTAFWGRRHGFRRSRSGPELARFIKLADGLAELLTHLPTRP